MWKPGRIRALHTLRMEGGCECPSELRSTRIDIGARLG